MVAVMVLPWLSRKTSDLLSISEKDHLGYGRTLIAYAGSGPPRHSTSTYDGPGSVFTIAILKNHGQPFYNRYKGMVARRDISKEIAVAIRPAEGRILTKPGIMTFLVYFMRRLIRVICLLTRVRARDSYKYYFSSYITFTLPAAGRIA